MQIKFLTDDFIRDTKGKNIICFGIGERFQDIYMKFIEWGMQDNITDLGDNNPNKQGSEYCISSRKYIIKSMDEVLEQQKEKFIFVICCVNYSSVVEQLEVVGAKSRYICYIGTPLWQNVRSLPYITSGDSVFASQGMGNKNIGDFGQNLTITILTLNRAELTIRLLDSMLYWLSDFKGNILIGDNGSDPTQLEKVKEKLKGCPFNSEIIEYGENNGTAKGRNLLAKNTNKEWIMQLDNDIYFTKNPFQKIQKDIALLGCHFMSLPYYDCQREMVVMYGSCLTINNFRNNLQINIGNGYLNNSFSKNNEWDPMLCTYFPGGASVYKKETFIKCGGYDENIFIAHEDIEFALRVFQHGYKVGNAGILCLTHDHKKLNTQADDFYENTRYSSEIIKRDKKYLKKKFDVN